MILSNYRSKMNVLTVINTNKICQISRIFWSVNFAQTKWLWKQSPIKKMLFNWNFIKAWLQHMGFPVNFVRFEEHLQACNFIEKRFQHRRFSVNIAKNLKTTILKNICKWLLLPLVTTWKVSKYGVISGPYFPVYRLNTEIYSVNLRIESEYREICTRNNSVLGPLKHSEYLPKHSKNGQIFWEFLISALYKTDIFV